MARLGTTCRQGLLEQTMSNQMSSHLDNMGLTFGMCRMPGETDDMLQARMIQMPDLPIYAAPLPTMKLFLLLAKLGLQSPRQYLPIGVV